MFEALKNWLNSKSGRDDQSEPRRSEHKASRPATKRPDSDDMDVPPQNDVLIRNKYVREDTGTHESLKILDDSLIDSGEEAGIDPYNTGGFDRSRNWETRFRK